METHSENDEFAMEVARPDLPNPKTSVDDREVSMVKRKIVKDYKRLSEEYEEVQFAKAEAALAANRKYLRETVAKMRVVVNTQPYCHIPCMDSTDRGRFGHGACHAGMIDTYITAPNQPEAYYHPGGMTPGMEVVGRDVIGDEPIRLKMHKYSKTGPIHKRADAFTLPCVDGTPKYTAWTYLKHNENAPDEGMCMFYTDESGETVPAPPEGIEQMVSIRSGRNEPQENYCIQKILWVYGRNPTTVEALAIALKMPTHLAEVRVDEVIRTTSKKMEAKERESKGLQDCMDMFLNLFCRRCGVFMCRIHETANVRPHEKLFKSDSSLQENAPCGPDCWKRQIGRRDGDQNKESDNRMVVNRPPDFIEASKPSGNPFGEAGVRSNMGSGDGSPSGSKRYNGAIKGLERYSGNKRPSQTNIEVDAPESRAFGELKDWTLLERDMLLRGRELFGNAPCRIARLISTKSCHEVRIQLSTEPHLNMMKSPTPQKKPPSRRKKVGPKRLPKKAKNLMLHKRANHNPLQSWPQFEACECQGQCDVNCPCVQKGTYCEKFCACSMDCTVRFSGCKCKGPCNTKRCPCRSVGRDCDPDKCRCCGAAKGSEGAINSEARCQNMCFACRDHKRVAMGMSNVAGWGAFLLEPVNKGDFLGEYTGDLITDQEAERRGKVYDKEQHSYLFDLNDRKVLDAKRRGNKLRFANHSANPNCFVRHHVVNGDHRIGIYAACNMQGGEELLYDYQYYKILGDRAPKWAVDPNPSQPPAESDGHDSRNLSSGELEDEMHGCSSRPASSNDSIHAAASALQSLCRVPKRRKSPYTTGAIWNNGGFEVAGDSNTYADDDYDDAMDADDGLRK